MSLRIDKHLARMVGTLLVITAAITGCKSLSQIAPPVDDRLVMTSGAAVQTLERGRSIYLTPCTACHVAEPIHDYSRQAWAKILPEMAKASKLDPQQAADVRAYIEGCLALAATP